MALFEPMEMLRHLNWVDCLCLAVAVRIIFISAQTGFVVEFFKVLAALLALFVTFHYYTKVGHWVENKAVSSEAVASVVFLGLWLVTLIVCKFIRDGILALFSVQAQSLVDKWGAVVIALGRAAVSVSMLLFLLVATGPGGYLQRMAGASMLEKYFLNIAPKMYASACGRFVTPLFPSEKKNPAVALVLKDVGRK
jgi:hypothetical protein